MGNAQGPGSPSKKTEPANSEVVSTPSRGQELPNPKDETRPTTSTPHRKTATREDEGRLLAIAREKTATRDDGGPPVVSPRSKTATLENERRPTVTPVKTATGINERLPTPAPKQKIAIPRDEELPISTPVQKNETPKEPVAGQTEPPLAQNSADKKPAAEQTETAQVKELANAEPDPRQAQGAAVTQNTANEEAVVRQTDPLLVENATNKEPVVAQTESQIRQNSVQREPMAGQVEPTPVQNLDNTEPGEAKTAELPPTQISTNDESVEGQSQSQSIQNSENSESADKQIKPQLEQSISDKEPVAEQAGQPSSQDSSVRDRQEKEPLQRSKTPSTAAIKPETADESKPTGEQVNPSLVRPKTPVCKPRKSPGEKPQQKVVKSPAQVSSPTNEKASDSQDQDFSREPASPPARARTPMCEIRRSPRQKKARSRGKSKPGHEFASANAKKKSLRHGIGIMDEKLERILADLESEEWYHGFIPFEDIVGLLHNDGDFLVRAIDPVGEKPPLPCITVKWDQIIDHPIKYRTKGEDRLFTLDGTYRNGDITELLRYHLENGAPIDDGVTLINPIPKQKWELTRDKIRFSEKIGVGHSSEVYAGRLEEGSLLPPIDVAIKKVKANTYNQFKINNMYKEARVLRQYKHRNIVAFYGIVDDSSIDVLIVTELVHGERLSSYIRRHPELSTGILFLYASDVAYALLYLHNKKALHRDVACHSCMLDKDHNRVKLSNLGLTARGECYKISKEEKAHLRIRWHAPEVIKTGLYTTPSDVFSYGILVWEIFHYVQRPYGKIENHVIREKISKPDFRPGVDKSLPEEIKQIMEFCWKADPSKRPVMATVVGYIRNNAGKMVKEDLQQKAKAKKSKSEQIEKMSLDQKINDVTHLLKVCEKS
uniref:Tyrosine-protein kinase n=1 Tax=Haemonchus contortus TaxID=6289 RepID=A0A7I4YPR1_HAECO